MKNIFKLMGIALLASSMIFVSCKKDNGGDEPTPQQENVYTLKWDGQTQNPGYVGAMTNGQMFAFQAADHIEGQNIYLPIFTVYMMGTSASDMAIVPNSTEVGIETVYSSESGQQYLDWQYDQEGNQSFKVTAFDATTYKMSAEMSLTFYSLADYIDGNSSPAQKVMDLTLTNYTFEMVQQ